MEFKFENKPIKNIDIMKKDLANYIFKMKADELYRFIGYLEHEDLKLPKSIFTCEKCATLNGNNCDMECCEKRFKKYCEEEHKIINVKGHNCHLCKKEWLGRCFGKHYGKDVSVDDTPVCEEYEFGGSQERLREIEQMEALKQIEIQEDR